jgi:hypothetical protein
VEVERSGSNRGGIWRQLQGLHLNHVRSLPVSITICWHQHQTINVWSEVRFTKFDPRKFSPFSLFRIHLTLWFSWEEGASAPSSFSSPFRHLFLPYPYLPASFVANPLVSPETLSASLEVLSAFSEALCYCFPVVSASSEVLPAITLFSNTSNSGLLRPWHRARTISADFRFNFLKIRSIIFRKPKPETPFSTVLLGRSASCRLHQHARLPTTRRRVAFTRSRVDLTCGCVAHTRRRLDRYLLLLLLFFVFTGLSFFFALSLLFCFCWCALSVV